MSSTVEKEAKDAKGKSSQQGKRHRSPGYPVIALGEAIEKAKLVFQQDKRAFTTPDAIITHLGYKKGGSARRVVSALRQYGLLDEESGKYRVSELGFKVLHLAEASEERLRLVREAALNPPIIQRVVDDFGGELPSDTTLKEHLILTEKFNPDSVESFIEVLRETLALVKLPSVGYTAPVSQVGTSMSQTRQSEATHRKELIGRALNSSLGAQLSVLGVPTHPGQKLFPFYLSKEQEATLYVPASMTQKEYDQLKKQIENSLAVMEATILANDEQTEN